MVLKGVGMNTHMSGVGACMAVAFLQNTFLKPPPPPILSRATLHARYPLPFASLPPTATDLNTGIWPTTTQPHHRPPPPPRQRRRPPR